MPYNPERVVGEVLGARAVKGADPSKQNFLCPYINSPCPKRSTNLGSEPYPVCSIWRGKPEKFVASEDLICVCPKRFHAIDFLSDAVDKCWPGTKPENPLIAPEVKMDGFGNVDFVIADVDEDGRIGQFLSVELQAIDITGSVFPAYQSLRANKDLEKRPTYGLNWDNVYKRYITQLIRKGYFHHHWKSKIVAVIQEQVYQNIIERAAFMRTTDVTSKDVNIIFMTYRFSEEPENKGQFSPILTTIEGTSHASLSQAILYKEAPSREAFLERISASIARKN